MAKSLSFVQVTKNIYCLEVPYFIPVNVYLVRGDDGWTVVDTGAPRFEAPVMEKFLNQTGGELPKQLVLTHGHLDHAAAAAVMREQWRIPIAAGRAEVRYLTGPDRYNKIPSRSFGYAFLQISPPPLLGRNVQWPLDEGMMIAGMEVVAAPGHAPGMVALLHRGERALICGDVFGTGGDRAGDPPASFTYDPKLNDLSQEKLARLDFDYLLAGHGEPLANGAAKAREHVARHPSAKKKK